MKTKDFLIVALVPSALLLIPIAGSLTVEGWNWSFSDFVFAWVMFAATTFLFRLLVTRKPANLAYKAGAGLAVATGFFLTWTNLAVQIIGDENPAFILYFVADLIGLIGVGLSRFQPAGMARAAFAMAAALFMIPVIAYIAWPADFSPGVGQVFLLNGAFVAMFTVSGLLFLHAAGQSARPATPGMA